ncbi:hypothetical protein [Antarcticibacterium flavum]|uniref:hypothetical protein n=1 Tax=Antarcticibacterium flavum TaxID=2058175 RepID=UPI00143D29DC|nr:hypothetical protein [Antarcticibacterium flavum]
MNEPIRAFNELIAQVGNYLQNTHAYSGNTVGAYRRGGNDLRNLWFPMESINMTRK